LMVEDRKTKGSVAVTSSEKADSHGRYFKVCTSCHTIAVASVVVTNELASNIYVLVV
jgi:cytochrome c2